MSLDIEKEIDYRTRVGKGQLVRKTVTSILLGLLLEA